MIPFPLRRLAQPDVPERDALLDDAFDVVAHCREEISLALQQSEFVESHAAGQDLHRKLDPVAERDRLALIDERAFLRRFWFKVGEAERAKILGFKKAKGVTDGEITLLWWTDSLDMAGPEVRPAPSRLKLVRGYAVIAFFSLLSLVAFSGMIFLPAPTVADVLLRVFALGICLSVWCAAMVLDVWPYAICKRIANEASQAGLST